MLSSRYALAVMTRLTRGLRDSAIYLAALKPHLIHYPMTDIPTSSYPSFLERVIECYESDKQSEPELTFDEWVGAYHKYLRSRFPKAHLEGRRPGVLGQTPDGYTVCAPPVYQVNGQLMGSIVSFNILCVCNLGGYLAAKIAHYRCLQSDQLLDDDQLKFRLRNYILVRLSADEFRMVRQWRRHVLINGDDLLAAQQRFFCRIFFIVSAMLGLELSVGKTYEHLRYANINSTCFDVVRGPDGTRTAYEIPYLNTGLYFGNNKVMSTRETDNSEVELEELAPHVAVIDRVVEGALPGKSAEVLRNYVHHHRADLLKECRGRNLFVARSLGGFGCRVPCGFTFHVTPSQKSEIFRILSSGTYYNAQLPSYPRRLSTDGVEILRPWYDPRLPSAGIKKLRKSKSSGVELNTFRIDVTVDVISIDYFKYL
ncbi:RNA-dependent RNA polymerase, partial [viral metagenome]